MGPQFHETKFGAIFFNSQLPDLIRNLGKIADALEKKDEVATTAKYLADVTKQRDELLEALINVRNMSYDTARPTKSEREYNWQKADEAINNAKQINK